jgi:GT2 family glycosyltransferase
MLHVITLSYNGFSLLSALKDGLEKNLKELPVPSKWYIRSNGCKDNTVEEVSKWAGVELLNINHNRDNFAKCVNSLVKLANPSDDDVLLLLNNDITFQDNYSLKNMMALMQDNVGIVGARLLYPNTDLLQHAGVIFSNRYNRLPYHYRHKEKCDKHSKKNRYFQCVTAAVALVSAKDFKDIGGMDEKYHWCFEDVDMNFAIGSLGKKIAYCGQTNIFHHESLTVNKTNVSKLFLQNNVSLFRKKWNGKYKIDHDLYLSNPSYMLI